MKLASGVVSLAVVLGVTGAPADGAPDAPKLVDRAVAGADLRTDGNRYAAYTRAPGVLALYDGTKRTVATVQVPAGCTVTDGTRGAFLVICVDSEGTHLPYILRPGTRQFTQVPGGDLATRAVTDDYEEIGRYWLQGTTTDNHGATVYRNWHTGQLVFGGSSGSRNINSRGLAAGRPGTRVDYRSSSATSLVYHHNGHHKTVAVCAPRTCLLPHLSKGLITWIQGNSEGFSGAATAYGYNTSNGKRYRWRVSSLPGHKPGDRILAVDHTATRVLLEVAGSSGSAPYRVYAIKRH